MSFSGPLLAAVTPVLLDGRLATLPPLGLYVHLPWCARKCPYCDFNSHALREELPEGRYLDALERDLEQAVPLVWGREVGSIFIGGGTPSLFTPEGIDRLLAFCRTLLRVSPLAEITLEANPGTFDAARFRGYRDAGVNRLSLGIQSFDDANLRALGRMHDGRQAWNAAEQARELFERVNLDLMYALPRQGVAGLDQDLARVLSLAPGHVSAYHLTLEPNTPFAAAPPPLPDDDTAADMQTRVEEILGAAGYGHYETSAFARPDQQCHHNLNYWTFGDYLGIGAGAHGKLSFQDRVQRQVRLKHPRTYMETLERGGAPVSESRDLDRQDRVFEFMMNALRLNQGFELELFAARTGLGVNALYRGLAEAERRGLITRALHRVTPSPRGRRFLNDLLALFLP
ncbi:MAG TPA: radical SAM family heme chaperone HemW [Thiobacillaceae bacterium]|nr:radical SAM family heme chaperone HemW [Thiobacillaceae bacterium]HNU64742.1 radical SAM family heme chaperone HemW [Thiobacillaceae bacterium]